MKMVTRDELLQKVLALPRPDRTWLVQELLSRFPELDEDGLDDEDRARLHAELDRACQETDTVPAEEVLAKLGK